MCSSAQAARCWGPSPSVRTAVSSQQCGAVLYSRQCHGHRHSGLRGAWNFAARVARSSEELNQRDYPDVVRGHQGAATAHRGAGVRFLADPQAAPAKTVTKARPFSRNGRLFILRYQAYSAGFQQIEIRQNQRAQTNAVPAEHLEIMLSHSSSGTGCTAWKRRTPRRSP